MVEHLAKFIASSLSILLMITNLTGCKSIELSSRWRDQEVAVDGINNEWGNATTFLEDQNALIGVMNDEDYLYLSLITNDRFLGNRMTLMGLTLWFDPKGGKKKAFGIQYPLGLQEIGAPMMGDWQEPDPDSENRRQMIEQSLSEIKFLGSDEDDWDMMSLSDAPGIEAKVNATNGTFVYELRIPLAHSEKHPYAVGAEVGKTIGIGLETQQPDRGRMTGMRGGGMRGGDMGPRSGGRPGGFGSPPGGMGPREMLKPLKWWGKLRLTENDSGKEE